jgi:hypothetical protein
MKKVKAWTLGIALISALIMLTLASCDITGLVGSAKDAKGLEAVTVDGKGLSAQFPNSLLVSFDPSGGSVDVPSKIVKHGPVYGELPVPSLAGHAFGGWWTEPGMKGSLVTAATKVSAKSNHVLYAAWNLAPQRISGTAVVGSTCLFFEFTVESDRKVARVLVPVSSDGYIQNEKLVYNEMLYDLPSLYVDYASGVMFGMTESKDSVFYVFQGGYSAIDGFVGQISKWTNGVEEKGYIVGKPVFPGMNVVNYVGTATYLFPTPTPQTLLFNAVANFDTNEITGTWCESGVGWNYGIHGTLEGNLDGKSVSLTAAPLPSFAQYLLPYSLSVVGEGAFKNASKELVSGQLTLYYGPQVLPATLTAVRDSN